MTQAMPGRSTVIQNINNNGGSALDRANRWGNAGMSTMGKTQPNIKGPEKNIAGGAMSALGAAAAGATIGGMTTSWSGPGAAVGATVGAGIGLAQYYMS